MNGPNGKNPLAGLSEIVVLRSEAARFRKRCGELEQQLAAASGQHQLLLGALATLMHREGGEPVELSEAEKLAAFEHCWLRIRAEVLAHEDGPNSLQVSLVPVTDEERAQRAAGGRKIILP